ncbi:toxin-activating lysine-acyltransferase [Luteibacter sp. PPL552]
MKILTGLPNGSGATFATSLGYMTQLLFRGPRKNFPISAIANWLAPPVRLGQHVMFFDEHANPIGYATWAYLSDEVSAMMEQDVVSLLHPSEWNEGLNVWVTDLFSLPGFSSYIISHLRNVTFRDVNLVRALKRDSNDSLVRVRKFMRCIRRPPAFSSGPILSPELL